MMNLKYYLLAMSVSLCTQALSQNYFYVSGEPNDVIRNEILTQLRHATQLLGLENVTIAVMYGELPQNMNANIEQELNEIVDRKMYLIRLNSHLEKSKIMGVISHEMIHVCQFYTSKLKRHSRTSFSWNGERYLNVKKFSYTKRPWEIEAMTLGELLYKYIQKRPDKGPIAINVLQKLGDME